MQIVQVHFQSCTPKVVGGTKNKSYNTRFGVGIHVSKKTMDAMDKSGTYRVFCSTRRKPKAPGAFYTGMWKPLS